MYVSIFSYRKGERETEGGGGGGGETIQSKGCVQGGELGWGRHTERQSQGEREREREREEEKGSPYTVLTRCIRILWFYGWLCV